MIGFAVLLASSMSLDVADTVFRDGFDADACPSERIEVSAIAYFDGTLADVDVRSFDNIWGRYRSGEEPAPFPAGGSTATIVDFARAGYVAARLHVDPFTPDYYSGLFSYTSADVPENPHIDFSISAGCADFSPSLGACAVFDAAPQNTRLVEWSLASHDEPECVLEVGRDYFVNVRFTDPSATSPACPGDVCEVTISSEVALP